MHIYVISRVYKKEPTRWESILRESEQSRAIMRKHYAPLRNAIVMARIPKPRPTN